MSKDTEQVGTESVATSYQRTSIHEVAELAGVSISTVSRALNGQVKGRWPESAAKAQRVLEAARALNYRPDPLIRSLMGGRSQTIGLVGASVRTASEMHRVREVERAARQDGYQLYLASGAANEFPSGVNDLIEGLVDRRVDGLIVMGRFDWPESVLSNLRSTSVPCVFVGNVPEGQMGIQEERGGAIDALMAHLSELGHRQVTYLGSRHDQMVPYVKLDFYRRGAKEHGLRLIDDPELTMDYVKEEGVTAPAYRLVEAMLARGEVPTALACIDDDAAIGAMSAIHDAGLGVPEDISVAGFDDTTYARHLRPPLTTIYKPRGEVGKAAYELLKQAIDRWNDDARQTPAEPLVRTFEAKLKVRGTTGPARG